MKATKNQADAVRSYLAGLGFEITHCQALEVIARGEGFRSRHVKAEVALADVGQPASAGCPRCEAKKAMRDTSCSKCGSMLEEGYCLDSACMYHDWPQEVLQYDVHEFATSSIEKKYGIKKRVHVDAEMSNGEKLRLKYGEDEEHPDYERGDWLFQAATTRTHQTYWDWVATRLESIDSDELSEGAPDQGGQTVTTEAEVKAEYFASPRQAVDLDRAIQRLLTECSPRYQEDLEAWRSMMEAIALDDQKTSKVTG